MSSDVLTPTCNTVWTFASLSTQCVILSIDFSNVGGMSRGVGVGKRRDAAITALERNPHEALIEFMYSVLRLAHGMVDTAHAAEPQCIKIKHL